MKLRGDLPVSRGEIQKVLDAPVPFEGDETVENKSKKLLAALTPEQLEIAAQSSYAYWLATLSDEPPTESELEKMALKEIRRHLVKAPSDDYTGLLAATSKIRTEKRVDLLRACFLDVEYDSEKDKLFAAKIKAWIQEDIEKQVCFVRGRDKEGFAILSIMARTDRITDSEAFLYLILYIMERAIATTEQSSCGNLEKITVVLDFGSFKSSVAPSLQDAKAVAMILQHNYPERLRRLMILDPPFWLRTLYGLVSPFLDPLTKQKFIVCSGHQKKQAVISEYVEWDQAMPFMIPDGKLTEKVDISRYLTSVPFQQGYH